MPDGKRAELVDGEIFMMATPSRKHQRVLGELYSTVSDYIKKKVENAK